MKTTKSKAKTPVSASKQDVSPDRWKAKGAKKGTAKQFPNPKRSTSEPLFKSVNEVDEFVAGIYARRKADG